MILTIIIPYYKTLEFTVKLLDILIPQLTNKVEVILVEDSQKEEVFNKYPIKVLESFGSGVSKARNLGLGSASGDYVCFIDSDDMVDADYIITVLDAIKNNDFDYCTFGWKSTDGKFKVTGTPPHWNTSVWNCVYKNSPKLRFNEDKRIGEDLDFNLLARKGKSHHINKILYYYNNEQEDSLTKKYSRGEISRNMDIKGKVVIYRSYLSMLGGIETAIYNLCKTLHKDYNITFLYDTADPKQLFRLKKLVKCVKYNNQKINCDKFIFYGFNPTAILDNVTCKEIIQQICCDIKGVNLAIQVDSRVTKIFADSKNSADVFNKTYPNLKCEVLHNIFSSPERKRVLRLMTASRLSWEKGYERMKKMAKRMNQLKIPFTWDIFTNDKPNEDIDGMYFRKPRLNVAEWMSSYDYGVQLSETESWCCTATEFLLAGTPMVLTDFPSAKEQVKDGVNGFILNRDMSNLDFTLQKMYESNLKGFVTVPFLSAWTDLLGKKSKSNYKYDDKGGVIVKSVDNYFDTVEQRNILNGEIFEVSPERAEVLIGKNYLNRKFVEILE
jgi:glycosyltransferase involved in cell wall biosynthesis